MTIPPNQRTLRTSRTSKTAEKPENMFVLFTSFKLTLDERKTLTKISTRKPLTTIPQTSACFGHDEIIITDNKSIVHDPVEENWRKAFCIIGGESRGIRISSRNNERIDTITKKNFRIGFVSNFTLFFSTKLASFLSIRF